MLEGESISVLDCHCQTIISEQGQIDILVNNAGTGGTGPLIEYDLSEVSKAFDVNVRIMLFAID